MQLKKLESALGCQLLIRGSRQHQLTPEGQRLLGHARRMLDLHAETLAAFHSRELSGQIRLGVPDDYAAKYLTPALKRFAPNHGAVEIELSCEQSTALIPRTCGSWAAPSAWGRSAHGGRRAQEPGIAEIGSRG